jgi:hypothetical protein
LRRDILAFAAWTASVLVGRGFGLGVFVSFPVVGIIGNACVGLIEVCSMGCVVMGPVGLGLRLAMIDNSFPPSSFDRGSPVLIWRNPTGRRFSARQILSAQCEFSHILPRQESPTLCPGDQDIGNQLSRDRLIDTI